MYFTLYHARLVVIVGNGRNKKRYILCPVVVITGVPANNEVITTLAQQLKKLCGSGDTVKDGVIEIQGDHCEKVQVKLSELGYKVKRAGD